MFHPVSLSLQISLNVLPGPCLGLCVGVACFVGFVGLVVGFFLWGNLISITGSFQLLTDHVSHLSGNAGKKINTVDPIPLAALPPFGVYYCHTTTFERILREGIRPGVHSSRATDPRHIAIKLQASGEDTMTREVLTSPLNQRRFSVAIFVAIPSTARSGSQWFWVDIANNIVGTPTIPLESAHFHCALSFDNDRVVHHWLPTAADPRPRGRPIGAPAPVPTNPSTEASMNTNADVRLQLLLQPRNTATPAPAADDIPDATAPPEEEEPDVFDSATNAAFGCLLTALEHPAEASPIMDAPLYTVLSRLSHAHPWTSLILDLKDLMPDLDRHYHHQLLVGMLQPNPPHITPIIIVDQFLLPCHHNY